MAMFEENEHRTKIEMKILGEEMKMMELKVVGWFVHPVFFGLAYEEQRALELKYYLLAFNDPMLYC